MKQIFLLLAVVFSFSQILTTNLSAKQNPVSPKVRLQESSQQKEKARLLRNCQIIAARVNEYYAGMGAYSSSGRINELRASITQYLQSVGTPVARQLLSELNSRNFENM